MRIKKSLRPRLRFLAQQVEGAPGGAAAGAGSAQQQAANSGESEPNDGEEPEIPGAEALGDPGKKALDSMKSKWQAERAEKKQLADELAALRATQEGREQEHAAQLAAQKVKDEALALANDRIRKAEVRALAAGKFADPTDALKFVDLEQFEVSEEGEVDSSAITTALDEVLSSRPYLAAQGGSAPAYSPSLNRGKAPKSQLSAEDLKTMSPAEILTARKEGRLDNALKGK